MTAFLLRRGCGSLVVLLAVSFLSFALIGLMPGDPFTLMLSADPSLTSADVARLRALYGLDEPLLQRWLGWLGRVLRGDLGYSRLYAVPTAELLLPRLQATLLLMGTSLALALAIAIPAGIAAARQPGSALDRAISITALAGYSIPSFWLGLLLIILFAVELGWLPAGGSASFGAPGLLDALRHLVLPVLTLTLLTAGGLVRFVRGAMIEALGAAFIRTARAKGAGPWRVILRHALPHAAPTLVTVTALQLGGIFGGAVVVETIFAYGGLGKLIYDAVLGNDYNLAMATLLLATVATLLANLLADLLQATLDPRVDLHG